ncbi:MAG: zinc-dependent peptidase [Chitinophagales bacterium]
MFKFISNIFSKKEPTLSQNDKTLLNENVFYYNQLQTEAKARFETEVAFFLDSIPIYFQGVQKTRLVELLVASSAVIVTFGHFFRYKKHLTSVTIIKGIVSKTEGGFSTGEVRTNNSFKTMFLSEEVLIQGFKNTEDKHNVGIHEFVHILDVADGYMDGVPSLFMPREIIQLWEKLTENEMKNIVEDDSSIRNYGATNVQEFLTVCSEYFFERPQKLAEEHPEVYKLLSRTFQQNPKENYDYNIKKNFGKKKDLGRNEPCHCGSGKKYKKCHLK